VVKLLKISVKFTKFTETDDGSKKEEEVGYAVEIDQQSTRRKINIQRGTRSHHRRNTKATDNEGQRNDIY
jgi:hypothetical protein